MKSNTQMNSSTKRNVTAALFLLLAFSGLQVFAQTKFPFGQAPDKVIPFGEKAAFGNVPATSTWTVSNTKEGIFTYLRGNQINDYVFEKTGLYEIGYQENKVHSEQECNHPHFKEKTRLLVSPVKMTFDFSRIVFSEPLRVGSCEGITVTVPVQVALQSASAASVTLPNFSVSGIGAEIIGKPVNSEMVLKNGTQLITYQLSGMAKNAAYVMFDFVDANNQIQTYNHPEKLN